MDSGNSGSMQSSSGGDEEYDSRSDSISAFLNTPGDLAALSHHRTRVSTTSLHCYPPSSSSSLLDPLSIYLDAFARSPPTPPSNSTPLLNLDMPWPRGVGASDPPSCTDVFTLMGSAPPPSNATTTTPMGATRDLYSSCVSISPLPSSSPAPLQQPSSAPPPPHNPAAAAAAVTTPTAAPRRSSKKRSRASRRASTTVLTTDTSNFRAMVQEFTGLPAPPFSSSPFPRARFDLLHAAASSVMRSPARSDASPHFLLRPFAQRLPVLSSGPFSLASSSSASSFSPSAITGTVGSTTHVTTSPAIATTIGATATTSTSTTNAIANTNTTSVATASATVSTNTASSSGYQLPSDLGLATQHQSLPNMFDYSSLVLPSPSMKYSSVTVPIIGSKKAAPAAAAPSPVAAVVPDYTVVGGLGHGHAGAHLRTFPGPTEPTGVMPSRGGGGDGGAGDDLLRWVEGPAGGLDHGDQGQFRPAGGSCTGSQRGSGCKLNYAGPVSSECHAEKGSENVSSARGEGMLESWICSSD